MVEMDRGTQAAKEVVMNVGVVGMWRKLVMKVVVWI